MVFEHAALHQHLPCTPCGTFSRCPRFGGAECRNFTSPQAVFEAIETIAAERQVVHGDATHEELDVILDEVKRNEG